GQDGAVDVAGEGLALVDHAEGRRRQAPGQLQGAAGDARPAPESPLQLLPVEWQTGGPPSIYQYSISRSRPARADLAGPMPPAPHQGRPNRPGLSHRTRPCRAAERALLRTGLTR